MLTALMAACGGKEEASEGKNVTQPQAIIVNGDKEDYVRANEDEPIEEAPEEIAEESFVQEYIYDDVNKIYSKEANSQDEVVLRFVGDVCFYDGFALMGAYRDRGENIENCIDASLLTYMRDADIFMLNNEFCYSDRGAPIEGKTYAFRSKPSNVSILDDMGADIVSLANNHAYDWGPDALSDTIDILNGAKVPFVGAGKDITEAMKPVYFKVNGITISFVSATQIERFGNPDTKEATETSPGVLRTLDPTKACQVISEAKANSDFCIMYVHWGSENTDLVEGSQRDLANKYVASGADLIIGDHSHCLQGIDYIGDVPVFYSMSNYWFNSKTVDTGIAEIVILTDDETRTKVKARTHSDVEGDNSETDDTNEIIWPGMEDETSEETSDGTDKGSANGSPVKIKQVRFIPAIQRNCRTNEVASSEAQRILTYLQGISDYAEIDVSTGVINKSETNHNTQGGMNTSPTKKVEPAGEVPDGGTPIVPTPEASEE